MHANLNERLHVNIETQGFFVRVFVAKQSRQPSFLKRLVYFYFEEYRNR